MLWVFKTWINVLENQTGEKVKKLWTDNGLEYLSANFLDFCKAEGSVKHIKCQVLLSGTDSKKGITELFLKEFVAVFLILLWLRVIGQKLLLLHVT